MDNNYQQQLNIILEDVELLLKILPTLAAYPECIPDSPEVDNILQDIKYRVAASAAAAQDLLNRVNENETDTTNLMDLSFQELPVNDID